MAHFYISVYINKSEAVKKAKKEGGEKTPKEKKELSDEEKEYKSMRKKIQEKLIKFATRIPVFMYLTDYRERSLKDVITQLEPGLFKKVTGLNVKDFELLCSLGVFNANLMNAVGIPSSNVPSMTSCSTISRPRWKLQRFSRFPPLRRSRCLPK